MNLRLSMFHFMLAGVLAVSGPVPAQAQQPKSAATASKAQAVLDQAAQDGKFAFVLFYKIDDAATRAMAQALKEGVADKSQQAVVAYAQVGHPAEQALVAKYDVSRAPMPMTLAIAPNGAITGIFSQKVTAEKLGDAIVTPTMTRCMKSLQENKMVFVCVQTTDEPVVPAAVKAMQSDPLFKDRVTLVSMQLRDPEETRFLNQMRIDPRQVTGVTAVLLAPPGVLIGKYDANATKDQVAAALHEAGKCCDDAKCKHNHGGTQQATPPTNTRRN